jgi:archaellum biogenesis ATPase FlaH
MEQNLQSIIIKNLIQNEVFCRKALPHIKPEYFEGHFKSVYELILKFIGKYNKLPNATVLDIEFQSSNYGSDSNCIAIAECIKTIETPDVVEFDWLVDSTEKWCKDRAVYLAIMESISIIDGGVSDKAEGVIPEILSKALSVTFDTNVGHDYLENSEGRYEFYHKKEDKIPFDIEMLNVITNGGIPRKTLNVILAGTGVGKSLAMCHLAAAALAQGRNVLYITMEMSEERIAERIDANLFDTNIDQLIKLSKDTFTNKVKKISEKTHGKLIIKEYPTAAAHTGHFRALLNELKMKKNFAPDIIYIDYLNICASSRMKGLSGGVNTYSLIKSIAEEIRGLAVEFNVPIWSATQLTRSGFGNSDVEITDTSESFGLPATCDLMIALISTEQLEKMNQLMVKQLKNRYNDLSQNKRFTIGLDRPKMRLYDLADPMANITNDSSASAAPVAQTPFASNKKPNFSGFKV